MGMNEKIITDEDVAKYPDYNAIFSDTPYYDRYLSIEQKYDAGPETNFWTWITGKNAGLRDEWNANYYSELQALMAEKQATEYESYQNQVAQQKAAGLNSDLLGVSGAGQSAERSAMTSHDALSSSMSAGTEAINGIMQIASTIMSIATSAQNIKLGQMSKVRESLGLTKEYKNMALDMIGDTFNFDDMSDEALHKALLSIAPSAWYEDLGLSSKREQKRFERVYRRMLTSANTRGFIDELRGRNAKNRGDYIENRYGKGTDVYDEFFPELIRALGEDALNAQKSGYLSETAHNNYMQDYYNTKDGAADAGFENLVRNSDTATLNARNSGWLVHTRDLLEKEVKKGNFWAMLGLAFINFADQNRDLASAAIQTFATKGIGKLF